MNSTTAKFFELCHEISEFCHRNRNHSVFTGWTREKLFFYIGFHALAGTLFLRRKCGSIIAVAIGWPVSLDELEKRQKQQKPQFDWLLPKPGDCLLIAQCIGKPSALGECFREAWGKWPGLRWAFAFRHSRLVKFDLVTLNRFFAHG